MITAKELQEKIFNTERGKASIKVAEKCLEQMEKHFVFWAEKGCYERSFNNTIRSHSEPDKTIEECIFDPRKVEKDADSDLVWAILKSELAKVGIMAVKDHDGRLVTFSWM